ncbi:hypothetical protein OAL35_00150 [bacterium]|nr:hypothetical protein [bacterium]
MLFWPAVDNHDHFTGDFLMQRTCFTTMLAVLTFCTVATSVQQESECFASGKQAGDILIDDQFDREDADSSTEQVGNGWGTNSAKRAKGVKQVFLIDGAMKISRAKVADHGVSVTHEADFADAVITMRFKMGPGDDLGINIADMNEKEVHAGHLCVARLKPNQLEISDLKTGRMNLDIRTRRQSGEETAEDKVRIAKTTIRRPLELELGKWHDLEVRIVGDRLSVSVDARHIASLESEGIAHPTKSRLRLSVNKQAWVDDLQLVRLR